MRWKYCLGLNFSGQLFLGDFIFSQEKCCFRWKLFLS